MVGDSQDIARWNQYRTLCNAARAAERLSVEAPDLWARRQAQADAARLRSYAHSLTV